MLFTAYAVTWEEIDLFWFHQLVTYRQIDYCQLLLRLNGGSDKSFVDDLVASRYCKCESSLCCYEALRFILCFYDLFFSVKEVSIWKEISGHTLFWVWPLFSLTDFLLAWGDLFAVPFFLIRVLELEALYAYTSIDTVAILAQGKHSG